MKRFILGILLLLFMSSLFFACGASEESKQGITKEQRERMDKDKKDFEKKLPEDEDDG